MDQYYIIKILGRGSEGQVLLAEHKKTHEEVAIKRMQWNSFEDANMHLFEAHKLKDLNHKNIMKYKKVFLHKYSTETHFVCLLLEYCPGGDLQQLIQSTWKIEKKMKEEDIVNYSLQIAEGLEYLHEHNIIHRDLKPHNILIAADGTLKIGDFGISREIGTQSMAHTQCGTLQYMSYEMLNKEPYDQMTDMYSFGVIILQMMTGKSFMISMELPKKPNLFDELEHLCCRTYGYSKELFELTKQLLSVDSMSRPSASKSVKILKKIQLNLQNGKIENIKLALKDFNLLNEDLKLIVFSFLTIEDMFHIGLSCKIYFNLWEEKWWKIFITKTKIGEEILKITEPSIGQFILSQLNNNNGHNSSGSNNGGNNNNNNKRKRSGSQTKSPSTLSLESIIFDRGSDGNGVINNNNNNNTTLIGSSGHNSVPTTNNNNNGSNFIESKYTTSSFNNHNGSSSGSGNNGTTSTSTAAVSASNNNTTLIIPSYGKNLFKQQVFNYIKIHKPKRRRDMNMRGKNIVSEIHPTQVNEAAKFLLQSFKSNLFNFNTNNNLNNSNNNTNTTNEEITEEIITEEKNYCHPLLAYIFKETNIEKIDDDALIFFFTMIVNFGLKFGRIYVSTYYPPNGEQKEIQAISIWQHPYNKTNTDFWKMLRVGIAKVPNKLGFKSFFRILRCIEAVEEIHESVLSRLDKPHWTLLAVVVKPENQSKGLGSEVLLPIIRASDEASLPIFTVVYHYRDKPRDEKVINYLKNQGFDVRNESDFNSSKPKFNTPPFTILIRYNSVY